ncbi:MAG: hypothetical protein WHS77_09610 [Brevinematales bacterium]
MNLPCDTNDLKPQKGKMNLTDTLIKADLEDGQGKAIIREDNIFLDDNKILSNSVLIEYVNQLIAAIQGYREKYQNKKPLKGLFVGVQEANFYESVMCGDEIYLKGNVIEEIANIKYIKAIIEKNGKMVSEVTTKIFEVEDLKEIEQLAKNNEVEEPQKINSNISNPPYFLTSYLQRKFYSYINNLTIEKEIISFDFMCPKEFDPFDGHFENNPILPGIMLIEIANVALSLLLEKQITINSIKKMKIGGVITPYRKILCNVKLNSTNNNSFSVEFSYENKKEISRFNGSFI